jgi:thiol-disulfide isomerase/thioredoxin
MKQTTMRIVVLAALTAVGTSALGMDIGDPAPALTIAEWVQGDPVDLRKDQGKKVHMIEFWAVWCPPCKFTVPRLSEFQKKYKDDLVIVGVTAPDLRGNTPKAVKRFVKQQGSNMIYTVALDKDEATTRAYMASHGAVGIPWAFVVGRDGRIAWIGSPLDLVLDEVLPKIIAGTYDVEAAKVRADVDRRFDLVFRTLQMGQTSFAREELIGILKVDPANELALDLLIHIYVKEERDTQALRSWVRSHIASHHGNVAAMSRLANALCNIGDLATRMPDLALEAASIAYEASDRHDPEAIAAYACSLYQIGRLDEAVSLQNEAVKGADGAKRAALQDVLDYYNRCKELRTTTD